MTQSFEDILSMPIEDIKRPAAMPAGQYLAIVNGAPTEEGTEESPRYIFPVKLVQALQLDQHELAEALNGRTLSEVPMRLTHWLSKNGPYRLKIFLQNHLDIHSSGTLGKIAQEAPGREFIATVTHREYNGQIYAEITGTAHVGGAPRAA